MSARLKMLEEQLKQKNAEFLKTSCRKQGPKNRLFAEMQSLVKQIKLEKNKDVPQVKELSESELIELYA
jgi:hypothetical protein